ncbi:YkvA family protein [Chenggangzhangella methanolivorans]|uniref:YkvA family protein n=1 Tax=Chenggangzhangella methanolivorans TaxID=1437009 RepID=UPI00360F2EA3
MGRLLDRAKRWARAIKQDIAALWIAGRDPRTPLAAKIVTLAVVAYALSPIDLIPDFIPVLGYLDDLLIVPLGVMLAIRLIPVDLMAEYRGRAAGLERRPRSKAGLVIVLAVWAVASAALIGWFVW